MSNYLDYLEESTNTVKSQNKLSKIILAMTYLGIWAIAVIVFWFFTSGSDAMGYGIMYFWIVLPLTTFVISIMIGKNNYWTRWKWIVSIMLGIMYMLADYATFRTANMVTNNKINMPQFELILIGTVISLVGLGIGGGIRYMKSKGKCL